MNGWQVLLLILLNLVQEADDFVFILVCLLRERVSLRDRSDLLLHRTVFDRFFDDLTLGHLKKCLLLALWAFEIVLVRAPEQRALFHKVR